MFNEPTPDGQWRILYRDAFGEPKVVDWIFFRRVDAVNFALTQRLKGWEIVSQTDYNYEEEEHAEQVNREVGWWRSRIPRPVLRTTTLVDENGQEPEYREVAPPTTYTSIIPRSKVTLFKSPILGKSRPAQAIDDDEYYSATITQNG